MNKIQAKEYTIYHPFHWLMYFIIKSSAEACGYEVIKEVESEQRIKYLEVQVCRITNPKSVKVN